ncbi:MAG: hypothetical protein FJZ38_11240 [Candidatus Rokubacteria bacterium]|nr:hypothetical protein [Candidatus Rokubacteria bacterium]
MSQRGVERVLGRLVTDETFRGQFFQDAWIAFVPYAPDLTSEELDALRRVPRSALEALCTALDDRICRLNVAAAHREGVIE